jgi:hypothetical protein
VVPSIVGQLAKALLQAPTGCERREQTMRDITAATLSGILGLLGVFASACWAEEKAEGPPDLESYSIVFQWNYSCPSSKGCSFTCPGTGAAAHTTKLAIYLGKLRVSDSESVFAIFYDYSTLEIPRGNGFSINTGLGTLSCQVNGMDLDYSGPSKKAQY